MIRGLLGPVLVALIPTIVSAQGLSPVSIQVDPQGNGVVEPGETATLVPSWRNGGPFSVNGGPSTLTGLTGPAGPAYSIVDGSGSYPFFPPLSGPEPCTPDCYSIRITAPARPVAHWDATATETVVLWSKLWTLHVGASFDDVPVSSPFYRFVETVLHNDVMGGCANGFFCASFNVPREHMPAFVLQAYQPSLLPPPCVAGSEMFADVPAASPYCRWIEELARRGVVAGCGGGNYCPTLTISRETMAVYLLATRGITPPPCGTPRFADVPASSPFCPWIEELERRGVVAGCGGNNYCPTLPVARDQMSVLLTVTFGLTLYGL